MVYLLYGLKDFQINEEIKNLTKNQNDMNMCRKIRSLLPLLALMLTSLAASAQNVRWNSQVEPLEGNRYRIVLEAKIPAGYHMYDMGPYEGGPNATAITFIPGEGVALDGAGLDADDDLVTLLPLPHILWDHIHRVLEVSYHLHNAVPGYLEHAVVGGIKLAEIPSIENGLDSLILFAHLSDQRAGIVRGIIVNKHQLKGVFRQIPLHGFDHRLADGNNIFLFIITGN